MAEELLSFLSLLNFKPLAFRIPLAFRLVRLNGASLRFALVIGPSLDLWLERSRGRRMGFCRVPFRGVRSL